MDLDRRHVLIGLHSAVTATTIMADTASASPGGGASDALVATAMSPAALMPTTDYYEIRSDRVGTRFAIWVTRPEGYVPGTRVPAIYLTDGNTAVQALAVRSIGLRDDPIHPIRPVLIVSVGYTGAEAGDMLRVRNRDLVPPGEPVDPRLEAEVDRRERSGSMTARQAADYKASLRATHADRFLAFLIEDLHPLIAARYAIDERQTGLFGYSYGGLFATWTALQRPPLFTRIGAGSPGMMLSSSVVFAELERQQREQVDHAGRHLHMTVQDLEITAPTVYQSLGESFARFNAMIGRVPLPGLDFTSRIIPSESHATGVAPAWFSFLRACYSAT
jgi:predicted alpha/beta superfamily hydrolase